MPVVRVYVVACDSEGCDSVLQYGPGFDGAKARRGARRLGWTVGRKVTCPVCLAEGGSSAKV